jgi:hypothetical protein
MDLDEAELDILRSMPPAEKLRVLTDMIRTGLELKAAGLRAMHPELTEAEVAGRLRELLARGAR